MDPVSLIGLVRVAGTPWAVEEGFDQAKGEVSLDHYEVRSGRAGIVTSAWPCWPCWPTRSWPSPAPKPPAPSAQRGTRQPERRAGPAPADHPRGPPAAGGAGVDRPGQARLRAGLV